MDNEDPRELGWALHVDGASSSKGCGAGVILEKEDEIIVELSIKFDFSVSNNQAEYEALIAGLKLAKEVRARQLLICSDSQIVTSQVAREHEARGEQPKPNSRNIEVPFNNGISSDLGH